MSALTNPRHERFAQELAKGKTASEIFVVSGLEPNHFSAPTGCYVYMLVDPRKDEVFYVGKGTGARALVHGRQAHRLTDLKSAIINAIRSTGRRELVYVLQDGMDRQAALKLERALIVRAHRHLSNISLGEVDGIDREARAARQNMERLKPLCVMWRECSTPARLKLWAKVHTGFAGIANRAAQ